MNAQTSLFETVLTRLDDFEFASKSIDYCPYGQQFAEWTSELVITVSHQPDVVSVNQAKLLLQDKWHEWRSTVPRRHRNHRGSHGHICIFQVYLQAYNQLRLIELSLTPPLLFLPPPPPPPPPPRQLAGIFLGEGE